MRAWFDIMAVPLFLMLLLADFHFLADTMVSDLSIQKKIFEASRSAEDAANHLLVSNCTIQTHSIPEIPEAPGNYLVYRATLIAGIPQVTVFGDGNS